MRKANKLRHKINEGEAAADGEAMAWLGEDISDIRDVRHHPDGSLGMTRTLDGVDYDWVVEFNPTLTAAIVRRLKAAGVESIRTN